jgi:hypothetical protein
LTATCCHGSSVRRAALPGTLGRYVH